MLGDFMPEKRHERFAALFSGVAPELFSSGFDIGDAAVGFVHEIILGATENFLPAQAVTHD